MDESLKKWNALSDKSNGCDDLVKIIDSDCGASRRHLLAESRLLDEVASVKICLYPSHSYSMIMLSCMYACRIPLLKHFSFSQFDRHGGSDCAFSM